MDESRLLNLTAQLLGHLIQRATLKFKPFIGGEDGNYAEQAPKLSPELRLELVTEAKELAKACLGALEPDTGLSRECERLKLGWDGAWGELNKIKAELEAANRQLTWGHQECLRLQAELAQAQDTTVAVSKAERQIADERVAAVKAELAACQRDKAETVTALLTADRELNRLRSYPPGPVMGTWREPLKGSGPYHPSQSHGGVGPCLNCVPELKPNTCVHGVLLGVGCPACGAGGRRAVDPDPPFERIFDGPPRCAHGALIGAACLDCAAECQRVVDTLPPNPKVQPAGATPGWDGPQRPVPSEHPAPGGGGVRTSHDGSLASPGTAYTAVKPNPAKVTRGTLHEALASVRDELELYPPQQRTRAVGDAEVTWADIGEMLCHRLELS